MLHPCNMVVFSIWDIPSYFVIEMEGLLFFIGGTGILNANGRFTTCSIPVLSTS